MFRQKLTHRDMADINQYTAKRLSGMAESLEALARACSDELDSGRKLTKEDGLAAMQMAAAMVCGDCCKCNLYSDTEKEDSYYLYYLLRSFEEKGKIEYEDMPRFFMETCKHKEDYVTYLNRNLGKATMNLEWKNRFLESRDTVMVQFRELAVILEEFSHQMERAVDITSSREAVIRRAFRLHHMIVERVLVLEYENQKQEAFLTVRTSNGKCVTAKDASAILGQAMGSKNWAVARDSKSLITRQSSTVRFIQDGTYRILYGVARIAKNGESVSGDNYTFFTNEPGQVIMSLSDGMGSGSTASQESQRVIELTQQLLEAGFSARAALKMVNTILLLTGVEQHPATLDLCCVDLHTGVLEAMKLGAVPTFIRSESGVEILEAPEVPAGVLNPVEPMLLSRKLWDGDRIVMVSDGVLDALDGPDKELMLKEFIEEVPLKTPQDLADRILSFACSFSPVPRDDMTVLTAVVWKRGGEI